MIAIRAIVPSQIKEDKQEPLYTLLCEKHGWTVDTALQDELKKSNEEVSSPRPATFDCIMILCIRQSRSSK